MHLRALFSLFVYRPKWQISLPFHILQLVKFLPFHTPEAWKRYPFGRSLPVWAIIGSTPPGGAFDYLKEDLHVYTINDIQLLKMYRLGSNSLGEQEHPRLEEVRIRNSLTERKHGPWFSWLLGSVLHNLRSGVIFFWFFASLAREFKKITPDTFI